MTSAPHRTDAPSADWYPARRKSRAEHRAARSLKTCPPSPTYAGERAGERGRVLEESSERCSRKSLAPLPYPLPGVPRRGRTLIARTDIRLVFVPLGDPMLRRLFNLLSILSLIFCLATCGIWVRSFYVTDQGTIVRPDAVYQVMSGSGALAVQRLRPSDGEVRMVRPAVTMSFLGAEVIEGRLARRRPWKLLLLPYWLPAGAAAIVPAVWLAMRAKREGRQKRMTQCPVCGEEFTATQETSSAGSSQSAASPLSCPRCGWAASSIPSSVQTPPASPPPGSRRDVEPRGDRPAPSPPPATASAPRPVAYRRAT